MCEYLKSNTSVVEGKTVLELGSGRAVCGIVAGKLGAKKVVCSDNNTAVLDAASETISINEVATSVETTKIDWTDLDSEDKQTYSVILASDILYLSCLAPPVFNTVKKYLAKDGTFLYSHEHRTGHTGIEQMGKDGIGSFLTLCKENGFETQEVFKNKTKGGSSVAIFQVKQRTVVSES